jgi:hypothetical protein
MDAPGGSLRGLQIAEREIPEGAQRVFKAPEWIRTEIRVPGDARGDRGMCHLEKNSAQASREY